MERAQYELKEIMLYQKQVAEIEKSPLQDRKEGIAQYQDMLENNLGLFKERVEWILNGSYGAGIQFSFARCSNRMNRRAWLFNNLAAVEFRTSNKYASQLWHKLDTDLQAAINRTLNEVINAYDADPITVNV